MANLSKFQLIVIGIFGGLALFGFGAMAAFRSGSGQSAVALSVWGPFTISEFSEIQKQTGLDKSEAFRISYTQVSQENFDERFVDALAAGSGPDLVFITNESIVEQRDKLVALPYENYPRRNFTDTFVKEGELFLSPQGVFGVPTVVDPLVLYWNRTLFDNKGIANPPRYWDEYKATLVDLFTKRKDSTLEIEESAIALGEYGNITNAKEILSALIMQAGSPITAEQGGVVRSVLSAKTGLAVSPAPAALLFYTDFSDPLKPLYGWNRSLPRSQDFFLAGDSATYVGFASELYLLRQKNPNLDFDVVSLPQQRNASENISYGRMYALAVPKMSKKTSAAFQLAFTLSSAQSVKVMSEVTGLPPARRDLLAVRPTAPHLEVFYKSALWAEGWLQPEEEITEGIFKELIESVTSGKSTISEAVSNASDVITRILERVRI